MIGSAVVYSGLAAALVGLLLAVVPARRLRRGRRRHGLVMCAAGVSLAAVGAALPAVESRAGPPRTRLDELAPAWQFRERHTTRVAAPPARVYEAIERVRADEILLFRTLTWIRRGGRPVPESILNPGVDAPILDIATRGGFVRLADEAPRELVIGAVVAAPPGPRRRATAEMFRGRVPPGVALAAMNFLVEPDPAGGSLVSTETRVFANGDAMRRRFAVYWRVIYPGSALIRRMWLRAVKRRAEGVAG